MSVCANEPCNAHVCERESVCVQSFNVCLLMSCVCATANVCVSECGKLMKSRGKAQIEVLQVSSSYSAVSYMCCTIWWCFQLYICLISALRPVCPEPGVQSPAAAYFRLALC